MEAGRQRDAGREREAEKKGSRQRRWEVSKEMYAATKTLGATVWAHHSHTVAHCICGIFKPKPRCDCVSSSAAHSRTLYLCSLKLRARARAAYMWEGETGRQADRGKEGERWRRRGKQAERGWEVRKEMYAATQILGATVWAHHSHTVAHCICCIFKPKPRCDCVGSSAAHSRTLYFV